MAEHKNIEEALKAMGTESIPHDVEQIAEQTSQSFTRALQLLASERSSGRIVADWLVDSFRKLAIGALAATACLLLIYFATAGTEQIVWADVVAATGEVEQVHITVLSSDPSSAYGPKEFKIEAYHKKPDRWRGHAFGLVQFFDGNESKIFDPNQGKFVASDSVRYEPLPEELLGGINRSESFLEGILQAMFRDNVPEPEMVFTPTAMGNSDIEVFDYTHDATDVWARVWVMGQRWGGLWA